MSRICSYTKWPDTNLFRKHHERLVPFVSIKPDCPDSTKLLASLLKSSINTDVSCAEAGESFSGNPSAREKVNMKTSDFAGAWLAEKQGKPHWCLTTGLHLYLSQFSISNGDSYTNSVHGKELDYPTPSLLAQCEINYEQANLWMNIQAATSTLHYDANNNILILLEGSKKVTLFSPSCTKYLKPAAAHNEHPNHSYLTPQEAEALATTLPTVKAHKDNPGNSFVYTVKLSAGDALFIPEGWWHQVDSEKCSMAVNFWFHSPLHDFLNAHEPVNNNSTYLQDHSNFLATDMSSYLLRGALRRLVSIERGAEESNCHDFTTSGYQPYSSTNTTLETFSAYVWTLLSSDHDGGQRLSAGCKRKAGCSGECDQWVAFVSCDVAAMQRWWLPFAQQHPADWTRLLLALSPAAADQLLTYWDRVSGTAAFCVDGNLQPTELDIQTREEKFFEDIFQPCGDAVPEVRRHLIAQKDQYCEQIAKRVLQRVLGTEEL